MEITEESKEGKKIARNECPDCGNRLVGLGVTLGATKLVGCIKCRRVFWVNNDVYEK